MRDAALDSNNPITVSAEWLEQRLGAPGLSIVDAAWYLPVHQRDARAEYEAGHIPGAVFFDHDAIVDPDSALPHALPPAEVFARHVGGMGITAADTIVVHDGPGMFSAARAWWLFRSMGAKHVRLLEGGLDGWKRDGRPLTTEPTKIAASVFDAAFDASGLATLDDMRGIVAGGGAQIADARPAGRFEGSDPEPRAGLRGGHMPGARNLPSTIVSRDGRLLPPDELKAAFAAAGIDLNTPVVATCGSGVSAANIILALETLGHRDHRLYDGSWAEWGGLPDTPVATGKA